MNQRSYVKAVSKRLVCSKARQVEFVGDLESDIAAALDAGEPWEQIEQRMGDPRQVASEFNEDLPESELAAGKKRKRTKIIMIVAAVMVAVAAVIATAVWWVSVKPIPVGQGSGLTEQQLVTQAEEVVALLDNGDFEALRAMSDQAMREALENEALLDEARATTGGEGDWGAFSSFGNEYVQEFSQMGITIDVVEMVAIYEHATVTYVVSFTNGTELIGIGMK